MVNDPTRKHDAMVEKEGARGRVPSGAWRAVVSIVLAAVFLIADQLTKIAVRHAMMFGLFPVTVIPGVIDFDFVANSGVAFGLAAGYGFVFVVLAVAVVIGSAVYLWRAPAISRLEVVGLGMLAGGAIGNAIDRALHGYVTDFIATTFIDFPVFNVADIGITVGVALALVGFLFLSPANERARQLDAELTAREAAAHASVRGDDSPFDQPDDHVSSSGGAASDAHADERSGEC